MEQNACETADSALSVVPGSLRRAALRTAASEKTSPAVLQLTRARLKRALSLSLSFSSVRRVCVCQQVHSRRISALPATFME